MEEIPKYLHLEVVEDHNLDKEISLRIKANLKVKGSNLEGKDLLPVDLAQVAQVQVALTMLVQVVEDLVLDLQGMEEKVKVKQVQVGLTTLLQVMEQDLVLDLLQEMEEEKVKVNQVQVMQDLVLDLLVMEDKANQIQVQIQVALVMQV